MRDGSSPKPDWDRLYRSAASQDGYITTEQAAEAGYSPQLLRKHALGGRIVRVRRGIHRLVHFPASEHEELAVVWLWSERSGVFTHETALALHDLSDALPHRLHLTLPPDWRRRRIRVPEGVELHFAEIAPHERSWFGPVPITSPGRTLNDCARASVSPDILRQAAEQAIRRGLVRALDLDDVREALEPFGGLAA